jgi:PST family polysaccharide transporter
MTIVLKRKVALGVAWSSVANWGGQIISFGVYAGLARLLDPHIFGLVAIAFVYVSFMQVFVTQGFGTAIVQRKDLEPEHIDSAFWINMGTAFALCAVSFALEGRIARVFHEPSLAPVIGWLSLSFPLLALSAMPGAILAREMNFRTLSIRGLGATVVGGATGLAMARFGWGVWSLVGQQIMGSIFGVLFLWSTVQWRPGFRISKRHLRDLYRFSVNLAASDLLWFFASKSDQTLVGYGFGPEGLGPYSLASRLNSVLQDGIATPLQTVALPAFSKLQSDQVSLERALRKFCEISCFLSLPLFAGLIAVAPQAVPLMFGPKWIAAIPLVRILAICAAMRCAFPFLNPLLLAKGRSGLQFLILVVQSATTVAACWIALRWNTEAVAWSMVSSVGAISALAILFPVRMLGINIARLIKSFVLPLLASIFMLAVVDLTRIAAEKRFPPVAILVLCVAVGFLTYSVAGVLIMGDLVGEIWETLGRKQPVLGGERSVEVSSPKVG